jgi:hypothetical protein
MELLDHWKFTDAVIALLKPIISNPKIIHHGHTICVNCSSKQQFTKSINLINKSELFECHGKEKDLEIYVTQIAFLQRKGLCQNLPKSLALLEPLLHSMGYRWSTHYVNSDRPNECWSVVNTKTGHAGQVGMIEEKAIDCVVRMAASRIETNNKKKEELRNAVAEYLK